MSSWFITFQFHEQCATAQLTMSAWDTKADFITEFNYIEYYYININPPFEDHSKISYQIDDSRLFVLRAFLMFESIDETCQPEDIVFTLTPVMLTCRILLQYSSTYFIYAYALKYLVI